MEAGSSVQKPGDMRVQTYRGFLFLSNLILGHSGALGGLELQSLNTCCNETQLAVIYCSPKEEIGWMIK